MAFPLMRTSPLFEQGPVLGGAEARALPGVKGWHLLGFALVVSAVVVVALAVSEAAGLGSYSGYVAGAVAALAAAIGSPLLARGSRAPETS